MKKFLKVIAPLLVLGAGFGVVQAMMAAKQPPEKKPESQRLVSLFVDVVREDTVTLAVTSQGEVRAKNEIDLIPQVSGRIVELSESFAEGAGFNAGEVLLRIDDTDYQLALTRAEARVTEADLRLMQEKASAGIKRKQWESTGRVAAPTPLQINRPQVIDAEAQLRSAQADLQEARVNLSRTKIHVPFQGRVMTRVVGVGQFVSAGTLLGRVFSTDRVEVRLPLSDAQLAELGLPMGFVAAAGSGPEVTFASESGGAKQQWTGHIVRTHAAVDQQTRLIYAVAEVNDPYGLNASDGVPLAVGMFVSAGIKGRDSQQALVMPRQALRNADQVYVVNADDKLEIRTVAVLSTTADVVMVSDGVLVGERVVTSTIPNAVDGMLVQPISRIASN